MYISDKFFEKEFVGKSSGAAYKKACMWAAKNLVSNCKAVQDSYWRIEKDEQGAPKVKLIVYCLLDETVSNQKFCEICKEYHGILYSNDDYRCTRCNHASYRDRLRKALSIKKEYIKRLLKTTESK